MLRMLGGSQFRKFCIVGIVILVLTVWITCWTQEEPRRKSESKEERLYASHFRRSCVLSVGCSGTREVLNNIYKAVLELPKPIQKVCFVQIFAFMAWCVK